MDKTTPRPWKINGPWIIARELLNDGNWHEREVATAGIGWRPFEDNNANAALIVKAVNSYDATQAALKALVEVVERIKFQKSPLHGGLVVAKHHGAEAYFAETLALMDKALRLAQEVQK